MNRDNKLKNFKIVKSLPELDKSLKSISKHYKIKKEALYTEIAALGHNPERAVALPGFHNIRTCRIRIPKVTGTRGGLRFYCYIDFRNESILPLKIRDKRKDGNLTKEELKQLNKELKEFLDKTKKKKK